MTTVQITEDLLTLPTAGIGFDNPNTLFFETGGYLQDCTYPCAFHNHFLREKLIDRQYRRITFENPYLIVEFLPELGGRIWRLYDKLHEEEVVHKNDCVKPYPGGFGGAYTAGGIELNYPFAHSITNTWPRKTEYRQNPDGSATYTVSEWERVGRSQWAMTFTLHPNESKLRQKVAIYNRGKLPMSFCYWGNAGVPVGLDTKWIYKECIASEHGYDTVYTWPEFKGIDLSWYKNNPEVIGIYLLDPKYNFFGIIDVKKKSGLIHFADRRDVPGKKLWTWGRNFSGEHTASHLSVEPQFYGEVQSGRTVNQEHFEWLAPEEYRTWEEQWSPIYGLTDVHEVTKNCAFQLQEGKLVYYPFAKIKDQRLQFIVGGKVVREIEFLAETSKIGEIDISDLPGDLEIRIVNGERVPGVISLAPRCEKKLASEVREDPFVDTNSSMACFVNGEFHHKLLKRDKAIAEYERAIELDRYNYRALTGLGKLLFSHGDLEGAKHRLLQSIEVYKWDAEAHLMLSHIQHLEGDIEGATESAHNSRYYGELCRANIKLGELAASKGEFEGAISFLEEAIANNRMSLRAYALIALCRRKLGHDAPELPESQIRDLMWSSEMWFSGKITELREELFSDEWRFLELALTYWELGLFEEAERLIGEGIEVHAGGWELEKIYNPDRIWGLARKRETPLFHMLKAFIALKRGKEADFRQGDYFEYFVNINQPEMVDVLQTAAENGCTWANHYLGNYAYHSLRPDEAIGYWEASPDNSVNLRNKAVHAQFVEKDIEKARGLLRKALAMNPDDLYLRLETIGVERVCGASADDVLAIYLGAPEEQKSGYLFIGLIGAYMDAEKWQEAAQYMAKVDRRYCDYDSGWHNFCMIYADWLLDKGKSPGALEWVNKARPTPPNLSYVNHPEEWLILHREHYLRGLAYKALGDQARAEESFRKSIEQPAEMRYFKPWEDMINSWRFWVALSMDELGMHPAARGMLAGINAYREAHGLMALKLDRHEMKRWAEKDPNIVVAVKEQTGPEI